ncbi:MAG: lipoyl(octanoyl) transferase LipB [Bdellovibrionales bacterium]
MHSIKQAPDKRDAVAGTAEHARRIEWQTSPALVAYPDALQAMEDHVAAMIDGRAGEKIWLLEHPPLYTAGTGADKADLLSPQFPVYETGRGGKHTYHGPGQRIVYVMLDLNQRGQDLRKFVWNLEEWIIRALARLDIAAGRRDDSDDRRVGLWVKSNADAVAGTAEHAAQTDNKVAAIGIRVRKWVTYHGVAINVNPDLSHYAGIVPCGIKGHGITSLAQLRPGTTMADIDAALQETFGDVF